MLSPPGIFGKPRESARLKASFNPSVQSSSRIGSSKKKNQWRSVRPHLPHHHTNSDRFFVNFCMQFVNEVILGMF